MKYYSEEVLKHWLPSLEWLVSMEERYPEEVINIRRCRNCEYFIPDCPAIDTNGDFGYCEYKTDFNALEENWPINWYFTDINGFCREDDIE